MEMSEALQLPVSERIGGEDVTFPLLELDDYGPIIARLRTQRKARGERCIPKRSTAMEEFRMRQVIEFDDPSMEQVALTVYARDGALDVLRASLAKAGRDKGGADSLLRKLRPGRLIPLAIDVSALFERRPPPEQQQEQQAGGEGDDPNAGAGDGSPAPDSSATTPAATGEAA